MRDWRIFKRFSLGVGIWEDTSTFPIEKTDPQLESESSTLLKSKFTSKHENWSALTISEKLEQIDQGKSFFLKITSEESSYLALPNEFKKHSIINEERILFIVRLAQSLILSNTCLLGCAASMEAQDIFEIKTTLEVVINSVSGINEKTTSEFSSQVIKEMAQVHVSQDLMLNLADLHLEKSQLAAIKHKKPDQRSLNEMYVSLWRLCVREVEKIAEFKKVSCNIWLASLSPLQHLAFYKDLSIGSSLHDSEILEKASSQQSFHQEAGVGRKDSSQARKNSTKKRPSAQMEIASPTKLISVNQPKSPNSIPHATAAMAQVSIQAPPLPPLPLKKKKSKKARNFELATPS